MNPNLGFKQLSFVNPFNGNSSEIHSFHMGVQNSLPSGADNDFYFSVVRNSAEHVVAMI